MKRCAILSMDSLEDFEAYDHLIEPHLLARGWQTSTVSWRKKNVDWSQYDVVLIRTPWDYQEDAEAFLAVLTEIELSTARLENSFEMVKWNIDKIYLQQLEQQGVPLVPTIWQARLGNNTINQAQLDDWFCKTGADQIVLKPRISANSDNTHWLKKKNNNIDFDQLNTAFCDRDFMVQPFVSAVTEEGEYSLFYFNGEYSHAILKTPKEEDFRVQEEHGGRLKLITPEAKLITSAEQCMLGIKQTHEMPLYARLDLIRFNDEFVLMEAEMIEPSLYFNMDPDSAERFAEAFVNRMAV